MVKKVARRKASSHEAAAPLSSNGAAERESDLEPITNAEAARRIGAALKRLHELGAFQSPAYDYLFDPNRPGPTMEEVEQIPYEDITADMPDWPGRKFPTAQS